MTLSDDPQGCPWELTYTSRECGHKTEAGCGKASTRHTGGNRDTRHLARTRRPGPSHFVFVRIANCGNL